jgi:cation:H+ antiporter
MSVAAASALFCGSVAVSLISSLVFARRLDRVSETVGVSEGLHGLFTALGADAPEISSAVAAIAVGRNDLGVGVVLGSNVFNLAGLLGLGALAAGSIRVHRHGLTLDGVAALAVAGITAAIVLGAVGTVVGLVLLVAVLAPYFGVLSLRPARIRALDPGSRLARFLAAAVLEEHHDARRDVDPGKASPPDFVLLVASLLAIVGASIGMVHAATELGDRWGVPDLVTGTLVLAVLTSLPNVLTAVRLALHRRGSAVVSESLNSNSLNVLAGIAVPGLFVSFGAASGLVTFSVWWLLGMTALVVGLAYARQGLGRGEGVLVVALYAAFAVVIASH